MRIFTSPNSILKAEAEVETEENDESTNTLMLRNKSILMSFHLDGNPLSHVDIDEGGYEEEKDIGGNSILDVLMDDTDSMRSRSRTRSRADSVDNGEATNMVTQTCLNGFDGLCQLFDFYISYVYMNFVNNE